MGMEGRWRGQPPFERRRADAPRVCSGRYLSSEGDGDSDQEDEQPANEMYEPMDEMKFQSAKASG